jgi:transposase
MINKLPQLSRSASFGREERSSTNTATPGHELIKLALDVHADSIMLARQVDNAAPERPRCMGPDDFLAFAAQQLRLAKRVVCCYEAGCFGFGLHRRLVAMGIDNFVLAPQKLDETRNRKTDRLDAAAMLVNLDRYLAGNRKAMRVVRIPTEAQERARALARQRDAFRKQLHQTIAQGRSHLLYCGLRVSGPWHREANYAALLKRLEERRDPGLAEHLKLFLQPLRQTAQFLEEKLHELTVAQQKRGHARRPDRQSPAGMGALIMEKIDCEVCDWNRFANRRQVASYTGLCPAVSGSGGSFTNFSIDKHGNARLRASLIELAWLMVQYQPNYGPVARWKKRVLNDPKATGSARKKAIVAIARQLAVDLWRLRTGRTTDDKLGLRLPKCRRKAA